MIVIRGLLVLAACSMVFASMRMTFLYALTTATGENQTVVVFVALSAALMKITIAILLHGRPWRDYGVAGVGWVCAFLYDSTMISGFTAMTRDASTIELSAKAGARDTIVSNRRDKLDELNRLPAALPAEAVQAALTAARRNAGNCTASRAYLDVCRVLDTAERDAAAVAARARIEAELKELNARVEDHPEVIVYPEAHNWALWLKSLNIIVGDSMVAGWLRIVIVVLVDFGPIIAVSLALKVPMEPASVVDIARSPRLRAPLAARVPRTGPRNLAQSPHAVAVLVTLRDALAGTAIPGVAVSADGLTFSQRNLAAHLSIPAAALKKALAVLEAEGRVEYQTKNNGTVVKSVN